MVDRMCAAAAAAAVISGPAWGGGRAAYSGITLGNLVSVECTDLLHCFVEERMVMHVFWCIECTQFRPDAV